MKKFISFILCICISLFATACTYVTSVNLTMDAVQPWTLGSNFEECVYSVVKKDKNGVVVGKGQLTTTATVGGTNNNQTTIDCDFYFSETEGIRDTITSTATILNSSCAAISSSKEVILQSKPEKNYRFEADYNAKKVDYYMGNSATPTKTMEVAESLVLDNEAGYYIVRAFNPTDHKQGEFLLTNLYDCYLSKRLASYVVSYNASEELLSRDNFTTETKDTTWSIFSSNNIIVDNKIECYKAKINRKETGKSGTPVEMWLSKKSFVGGKGRVIVKMSTSTLSYTTAEVEYTTEYELVSYRIG